MAKQYIVFSAAAVFLLLCNNFLIVTGVEASSSNDGFENTALMTHDLRFSSRQVVPPLGRCSAYQLPSNVEFHCKNNKCILNCYGTTKFPDGKSTMGMDCVNGRWIIPYTNYNTVPACNAVCKPPCQNNGRCMSLGICRCPKGFSGPQCQNSKASCAGKPPLPKNSEVNCINNICNVKCMRGFQFPDGSSITTFVCRESKWIDTKSGLSKPPDCGPICDPPCANGGDCISFNVCQCSKTHRGDHCQYNIAACNVTKTGFNGNYKCVYGSNEVKCKLSCPAVPGLKVGGSLLTDYKCKYESGDFYPLPLPRCIYPEEHTFVEKLLAIIAIYKEHMQRGKWYFPEKSFILPSCFPLYITEIIDKTPKPALCTTWGGINVKTFDGLVYKAPLSCPHTLITDIKDATFDIILKACPYGSSYGCAHTLKIYWQSIVYTFENLNGTVHLSTPTKQLSLPVQIMGMKVMPVAQHLQIDLESVGLKIDWDGHQYVAVHAGPALYTRTGGLCGSLDGDYRNDLVSKRGIVVETVKAFTDAWRVDDKSDLLCSMENSAELEFGSESCDPEKRKEALDICVRLLTNKKLQDCIEPCNFKALLHTCVDDFCNCPNQDHPATCNCDSFAMLAKECAFKGIKLTNGWRDMEICPISCSIGRVYLPCGADMEPTCASAVAPTKGKCNEGCFCPQGTVQFKGACITPELCPCFLRGKEFKAKATIKKDCNTCTCTGGKWQCTNEKCDATCAAIGDPHYLTFDGKRFDFMGTCSYYLLKTSSLSVEAENVACSDAGNPSCTKSVTVRFKLKSRVHTVYLGQGLVTKVDGKEVFKFPKILGNGEVIIRQASSTFITVDFSDGLSIRWDDASRVYIDAPSSYREKTAGLCGTFNSNTKDDFLTPEGDVETAVELFAHKWRTTDNCNDLDNNTQGLHPCTVKPEKREVAEKYCKWIIGELFQDCHGTVEPDQYYDDCLYDVCACKDEPSKCFCPILSAYGTECMRQGIKTGWRLAVKECAGKCDAGQVFEECGNCCQRTCSDLASKYPCKKKCVEGCRCPQGEYLNDNNKCVPQKHCPCTYDGVTFKPGYKEVRPGTKVLELCTCVGAIWKCKDAKPGDKEKCPPFFELRAECARKPYAEFSKCVPKEPKSCKNMHSYEEDLEDCAPGCSCMSGYVYDTSRKVCVLPRKCSCLHGSKSYNDGEHMKNDCNVCTCTGGKWQCTNEKCDATCAAIGDPHYRTFDGKRFDFMGTCSYYLLKTSSLSVEAENVACSDVGNPSCTKSVTLRFKVKSSVHTVYLGQGLVTKVNGKEVLKFPKILGNGQVIIRQASSTVITVDFSDGLSIRWDDASRVYIDAPSSYREKTAGLCGTFNSNTKDDFLTPEGDVETAVEIFAHKWRTTDNCNDLDNNTQGLHPCTVKPEKREVAEKYCKWIIGELFQDCHETVEPDQYYDDCLYDVCACKDDPSKCFCPILSAYGAECMRQGIKTGWRLAVKECAVQCDAGQVFEECGNSCQRTCSDLASKYPCKKKCVEGCCCPHGKYLNDNNKCVPRKRCPCTYDGVTFKPGYKEVRPGKKVLELCTCVDAIWKCKNAKPGDKKKYPPGSELLAECAVKPYTEVSKCVPIEPKTCKNMHSYEEDLEYCAPGCSCISGYVYDTSRKVCVLPENCSCYHFGKSYPDGEHIKDDCNVCICIGGKWQCTNEKCDATCAAIGDPHYRTFDGKRFDFMGTCSYYLLKTSSLSVEAENVACSDAGNPSCTKSVTLRFKLKSSEHTVYLGQGLVTKVDGKVVFEFPKILGNGKVIIRQASSTFITVDFSDGLRIRWDDASRVYIDAPSSYREKTAGLCGTFNSNTQDDFLTPEGDVETAVELFAHKWRTTDTCDDLDNSAQGLHPCTVKPERREVAEKYCKWIIGELFQDCHGTVEPDQYYDDCLYDVCACKGEPSKCFCPILSAYGTECMRQGIRTGWRLAVKECAVKCDAGQVFDECGDCCQRTCSDLASKYPCKKKCVEGCRCPNGEYLNDNNKCVPRKRCPCTYDGVTFKPGYKEVRPGTKVLELCTCVGAIWNCKNAKPADKEKYPPCSKIRAECAHKLYAEFSMCVPKERKTCRNMHSYEEDLEDCAPGCSCMSGYVYDTSRKVCILPANCSCHHGSKSYNNGEYMKNDCNICTCTGGKWQCTDNKCGASCAAIGDPHYRTFDGKRFDFMGKCSYYLLKTSSLSVEVENVACSEAGNPSCTKSVTVRFKLKSIVHTVYLGQGLVTKVDGKEVLKFPKILGNGKVIIRQASSNVMTVEFSDGLSIRWDDASRVYIDAPSSYREKTAGLCGTFNSNTKDDFLTPEGDVETAVELFAHKWRTTDTCNDLDNNTQGLHPCTVKPEKREVAEKYCKWIIGELFQDCHETVEPDQYYNDCLYDVCACKDDPSKCFCPILSAYGTECMRQGIRTGWRLAVKECVVKCDAGQVFEECGNSCQHTCSDLASKYPCKKKCVEGCRCPHGEYLNDNNKCVPRKRCPCTYDGVTFKPGYKEVRPGTKVLELCTCVGAIWKCKDAKPGDKEKCPPFFELRAECARKPYAEFSKCVPKEPKSCKNMHSYEEDLEDCAPGCLCMSGYVYDTSRKVCVLPRKCSCLHGSKSYNDGEHMKDDCNICICQSGNWKCSSNGCESTCSVWGDSHFTTFDNHDFDFQGACDYILSKGVADNGDGYTITIQNVLCGTMGVTCSKSIEIAISTSGVKDSITLTTDSLYLEDPNKSAINRLLDVVNSKAHGSFLIFKAGVFIVIEVISLKLQVKWDEGTRVYVKLGNEWKHKVNGLCGNYNDNAMDDMQTPSQGLETSPLIFGHAWKVQLFCAVPTQPIDACREHPERETWAQLKCGVLKSSLFEECHAEVPVKKYLKRCIFDTCACDQGGDCECLCSAIAAYAHSCSQKGITIRWRTPHFCPMQCDPHRAEYKSCTPACGVETCDNFLDQGLTDRMCNKENCLEGCKIKSCDKDMIYLNDTYTECVPKSKCNQ